MMNLKVMVFINGVMENLTKGNSNKVICMVKESFIGQRDKFTKEASKMIKRMVMEN